MVAARQLNLLRAKGRCIAVLIAVAAATPLAIASTLTPATQGMGTHTALGLPPCGWAVASGMPCPSCGMTTSFTWAAHGDLWASFVTQPMGFVLALASAMTALVCLWAACTGARVQGPAEAILLRPVVGWSALVFFLAAWGWKIWAVQAGITP